MVRIFGTREFGGYSSRRRSGNSRRTILKGGQRKGYGWKRDSGSFRRIKILRYLRCGVDLASMPERLPKLMKATKKHPDSTAFKTLQKAEEVHCGLQQNGGVMSKDLLAGLV